MASSGNPNHPTPPFDLNSLFFKPPIPNPPNPAPPPPFHHHNNPPPNPNNPGARLMALIGHPHPPPHPHNPAIGAVTHPSELLRLPSTTKVPRGRRLAGDRLVYDVDVRLAGELQPQLEVTPITRYVSDPQLVLGRQIAVNNTYICYGLNLGSLRVLNINTALRALIHGHAQKVTDMSFFAEDVHLLASASIDGRVYVWKISEGDDEAGTQQISVIAVVAVQIVGEEGPMHPRVCWHCHKQEILVVAVSQYVLRIDTTKVGKSGAFTAEEPLQCSLDKLVDGIQLVGKHDDEVTDLSMCQSTMTRLVSASKDGTIKIWEDRKSQPLLVLKPHDGQPVNAAIFLTAPDRPGHIILITAGTENREVKLWTPSSKEGCPNEDESWQCLQTLELRSSAEQRIEAAFFNQVIGLPQVGLILLANAKKNAMYAVHVEYGAIPAATRMDYLAEFTVTMPILSFTGTSDVLPLGEHVVKVYCVQTQAIQQYALDLSQCLPLPIENFGLEMSDSSVSRCVTEGISILEPSGQKTFDVALGIAGPNPSNPVGSPECPPEFKRALSFASDSAIWQENPTSRMVSNSIASLPVTNHDVSVASPSIPPSPRLLRKPSDLSVDQAVTAYSVDMQMDNGYMSLHSLLSTATNSMTAEEVNPPGMFKHPHHLITPSEIIMATSSSNTAHLAESKSDAEAKIREVVVNSDVRSIELEVKDVGEARLVKETNVSKQAEPQIQTIRNKNFFSSQASELGAEMSRGSCALPTEASILEEAQNSIMEALAQPSNSGEEADKVMNDLTGKSADFGASASASSPSAQISKSRKQKGKYSQASGLASSYIIASNSADALNDTDTALTTPSAEAALLKIASMQKMMEQLFTTQKEMQKQMPLVLDVPVTKEGRRLEVALGRSIEKAGKANADALWTRMQEEFAKLDKLVRERTQQITSLVSNFVNKDLMLVLDKALKKEMAAVSANVARSITPVIEKTISSAISESFQKGVGDKAVNQLERSVNSRVEAIISRQIQTQFQTTGKQALQEGLKSVLEANIVPAFEMSCKAAFEQVDACFRQGMAEHITASQRQIESAHSPLVMTLRETINSASSITQTLSGELAKQREVVAFAGAGSNSEALLPLSQLTSGPLFLHQKVEQPYDPIKELSRLISEHKYEEAFTAALQRSDVSIVSWLCSQVDLPRLLSTTPLPLSQGVLLSLLQQLACDIINETPRKLQLMTDVAAAMNPGDPMIAMHARPVFEQVYQILNHHRSLPTTTSTELASIRVIMHVINSMLMTCK